MAIIRDFAITEWGTSTLASIVCEMPTHETNDILIYFASKDGAIAITDPAGIWTNIQDGVTAGAAYRCGWALATSSSMTLTLTTGTAENWTVVVAAIKNANTSTPIHISAESGSDDSAMPFAGPSTTTTNNNCLILHAWFSDSGLSPTAYAPLVNLYSGDNGANSTAVAYTYLRTAGAVTAASWYGRGDDDGRGVVMAINDNGSETEISPYSDPTISSGQVLRPLVGLAVTFSDSWPTSLTITALGQDFAANSVYVYESAPSWADDTTDANGPGTADVTWSMHNTGDAMYFGHSSKFKSLSFITSQAGVAGVVAWEYYNGSWTAAPGMAGAFTSTGGARVAFTSDTPPTDWVTNDPGMGQTKYWVRCRITTSYTTAVIQSQIRLNGYVAAYIVATAAVDAGTNPYTDATQDAGASSQANLSGPQMNFGSALDMDTGIIVGTLVSVLPSDFAKDIALPTKTPGGIQITFFDTNNNCLSYIVGAKGCKDVSVDDRNVWAIDWNGSATSWATCGTIDKSAVTRMFLSTLGYFAAAAHRWSMLSLITRIGLAGGTSSYPLDFDGIQTVMNYSVGWFPFFKRTGSAAMLYAPLQIGGGDPVRVSVDLKTFQFPKKYDGVDYFLWNVAEDVAGIKFYPKSGDVIEFTNSVFTSESSYRWEFDTASSSAATVNFAGSTVIGANVTLDDQITLDSVTFSNCKAITATGTLTNCTFKNTVGAGALNVATAAAMATVTNCTFSDNTTYGIRLTNVSADTYAFDGITFSGNTKDVYVAATTGTVTINVTNGDTPTYDTAGATVIINNLKTLTLTGLISGSEVRIYDQAGPPPTELDGIESSDTTFAYQYNYVASTYVDIVVHKENYLYYRIENYLLLNGDASLPIAQQIDRQYLNP